MNQEQKPDYNPENQVFSLQTEENEIKSFKTEEIGEKIELEPWENKANSIWKNFFLFVADILINAAIIITIVFTIRYFLVSPFQVSGTSMLETLHDKEYIIVNKLAYRLDKPQRGDPVVFLPPNHKKDYYVKRIIGIPGDTVIIENGIVKIKNAENPEGYVVTEDYLDSRFQGKTYLPTDIMYQTFTVPDGKYFVLGDNRTGSSDSRYWRDAFTNEPTPFIDKSMISGKVWVVLWPIGNVREIANFWN